MPKAVKWLLYVAAAILVVRVLSTDPGGAGHTVHQFFAGLWTFIGAI